MKNIASSEVSTEAVAEALADRLDAAFGFSSGGAEVWLRLAQGLRYGPVDMGEWDAKSRERVLAFPATEFGDVESAGAECVGDVVEGSIVTRRPTVHEIRGLAGGDYQAWTWCFFDALLVHVTGSEATQIRSECPRTGEAIVVNLREGTLDSSRAQGDWDGRELSVSLPVLFTPGANLREDFLLPLAGVGGSPRCDARGCPGYRGWWRRAGGRCLCLHRTSAAHHRDGGAALGADGFFVKAFVETFVEAVVGGRGVTY